jgi:GNAT superfamily N-acetyltransferase
MTKQRVTSEYSLRIRGEIKIAVNRLYDDQCAYKATNRGSLVGMARVWINKTVLIEYIGTLPIYRRRGIARQLMNRIIADYSTMNLSLIACSFGGMSLPELIKFYESLGFRSVDSAQFTRRMERQSIYSSFSM